jgi:hypothetical protein
MEPLTNRPCQIVQSLQYGACGCRYGDFISSCCNIQFSMSEHVAKHSDRIQKHLARAHYPMAQSEGSMATAQTVSEILKSRRFKRNPDYDLDEPEACSLVKNW